MKVLGVDFILRSGKCDKNELSIVVVNEDNDIEVINQIKTNESYEDIARVIMGVFNLYKCDKMVIDKVGVGLPIYSQLEKLCPKNNLIEHIPTMKANHTILTALSKTKILSGWGAKLELNVVGGYLKLKEGHYNDKEKWLSFVMATGMALKVIIDEGKRQENIEYKNNIENKIKNYMYDNNVAYINLGLGKEDDYYSYCTDDTLSRVVDILTDIMKS